MKLTEKTEQVRNYCVENGNKVSLDELAAALERTTRSISASVTDLTKKKLAERVKEEVEGAEKPVTFVVLNEAGLNFVPSEDEE